MAGVENSTKAHLPACVYAMWIMSFSASFYLAVRVCTRKAMNRFDPIGSQKSAFHSLSRMGIFFFFLSFWGDVAGVRREMNFHFDPTPSALSVFCWNSLYATHLICLLFCLYLTGSLSGQANTAPQFMAISIFPTCVFLKYNYVSKTKCDLY